MPGTDGAGDEPGYVAYWWGAPVPRAAVASSRGDIPRGGGCPVAVSRGGALLPASPGRHARLRAYSRERVNGGADLSAAGRAVAGDRAGGGEGKAVPAEGAARQARSPLTIARGSGARSAAAPADVARCDRVELRPPRCRGADPLQASRRLRRRLYPRSGGGGVRPRPGRVRGGRRLGDVGLAGGQQPAGIAIRNPRG